MRLLSGALAGGGDQPIPQKLGAVAASIGDNMNMDFLDSMMDLVHNTIRWNLNFPIAENIDMPHFGRNTPIMDSTICLALFLSQEIGLMSECNCIRPSAGEEL